MYDVKNKQRMNSKIVFVLLMNHKFYLISILLGFFIFYFVNQDRLINHDLEVLELSLKPDGFNNSIVASISIVFPLSIDLLFDFSFAGKLTRNKIEQYISRTFLLSGFLFTNITIYFLVILKGNFYLYFYLSETQKILVATAVFGHFNQFSNTIFTARKRSIATVFFMIGHYLRLFNFEKDSHSEVFFCLFLILMLLVLFLIGQSEYLAFLLLRKNHFISNGILFEDCCCLFYTSLVFIGMLVDTIYATFYWKVKDFESNSSHLTTYTYCLTAFVVFVTIIYRRHGNFDIFRNQIENNIKGSFTRYISHEIRSPLNTAFMGLKLLYDDAVTQPNNETNVEIIKEIKEACNSSLKILNDLSLNERLDSGHVILQKQQINVKESLEYCIHFFEEKAAFRGINIHLICDTLDIVGGMTSSSASPSPHVVHHETSPPPAPTPTPFCIQSDRTKWMEVISNLILNAINSSAIDSEVVIRVTHLRLPEAHSSKSLLSLPKSSPASRKDSISISISPSEKSIVPPPPLQPPNWIRIEFVDSSRGLSESDLAKLQVSMSVFSYHVLQCGQGYGLGLLVSSRVLNLLGGRLGVTSGGVGRGCTFFIEMPLLSSHQCDFPAEGFQQISSVASLNQFSSSIAVVNRCISVQPMDRFDDLDGLDCNIVMRSRHPSLSSAILNAANLRQLSESLLSDSLYAMPLGPGDDMGLPEHVPVPVQRMESDRLTVIRMLSQRGSDDSSEEKEDNPDPDSDAGLPSRSSNSFLGEGEQQYLDPFVSRNDSRRPSVKPPAAAEMNRNRGGDGSPHVSCSHLRVLLVDDVISCRKMLRRLLTGRVASLVEASDGNEAVDYMQTVMLEGVGGAGVAIDVILMDFVMPNMDGPEATRIIREMGYRGLVIGLTGNTSDADVKLFLSHGADRVMGKPFELPVFYSILAELGAIENER